MKLTYKTMLYIFIFIWDYIVSTRPCNTFKEAFESKESCLIFLVKVGPKLYLYNSKRPIPGEYIEFRNLEEY